MRTAVIALVTGGALAAAALPALAQSYDPVTSQREASIGDRIAEGVHEGDLSIDQASRLRVELHQIVDLDARYQDEGMSDWQVHDLNSRLSLLASRLDYDLSVSRDDSGY
jgi:hypothetical protein